MSDLTPAQNQSLAPGAAPSPFGPSPQDPATASCEGMLKRDLADTESRYGKKPKGAEGELLGDLNREMSDLARDKQGLAGNDSLAGTLRRTSDVDNLRLGAQTGLGDVAVSAGTISRPQPERVGAGRRRAGQVAPGQHRQQHAAQQRLRDRSRWLQGGGRRRQLGRRADERPGSASADRQGHRGGQAGVVQQHHRPARTGRL